MLTSVSRLNVSDHVKAAVRRCIAEMSAHHETHYSVKRSRLDIFRSGGGSFVR
jgi:hypothetical protein